MVSAVRIPVAGPEAVRGTLGSRGQRLELREVYSMQEQQHYMGRLEPGMDVCDVNGEKIGTVAEVHQHALAMAGGGAEEAPQYDEYVEVKTGFLGLGSHLYIPRHAFQPEGTQGCLFLEQTKDDLDKTWYEK